jgi:prepilin-type N-terminal cleavage/methylation domain-containing protein
MSHIKSSNNFGFTIVELLVVIVAIGILAGLVIVSYAGVSQKAALSTLNSDLKNVATQLEIDKVNSATDVYPASEAAANGGSGLPKTSGTTYDYKVSSDLKTYLLTASASGVGGLSYVSSLNGTVSQDDPYALPTGLVSGLVAYWKLDESSGARYDSVGASDLTDNNTVGYVSGAVNNAADFQNDSERLSVGGNADLRLTNAAWSLSFWFKADAVPVGGDSKYIISAGELSGSRYDVRIGSDNQRLQWVRHNATTPVLSADVMYINTLYHAMYTYNGTILTLYLNGVYNNSAAYTQHTASVGNFVIGSGAAYPAREFDGMIDEVGIWSRALAVGEVESLYNYGFGTHYN